jgi:hypothetical protein
MQAAVGVRVCAWAHFRALTAMDEKKKKKMRGGGGEWGIGGKLSIRSVNEQIPSTAAASSKFNKSKQKHSPEPSAT